MVKNRRELSIHDSLEVLGALWVVVMRQSEVICDVDWQTTLKPQPRALYELAFSQSDVERRSLTHVNENFQEISQQKRKFLIKSFYPSKIISKAFFGIESPSSASDQ